MKLKKIITFLNLRCLRNMFVGLINLQIRVIFCFDFGNE